MRLVDLAWPQVAARAARSVLAIPLGSCEQHGPHLPLDTDTCIAEHLAAELARQVDAVLVAPALTIAASGEHQGFPGTLSIGTAVLEAVLVETVRSADAFAGVVLVDAHGGNARATQRALAVLRADGRRVMAWSPSGARDAHAGYTETSAMLAIAPARVRLDAAVVGVTEPLATLMDRLVVGGVAAVSDNGVLGDPTGASAAAGAAWLAAATAELVTAVQRFVAGA